MCFGWLGWVRPDGGSGAVGIGLFGINLHLGHGFFDLFVVDLALVGQGAEGAEGDVARVHLEVVAQGLAAVAAPEAVGAQRYGQLGEIARDGFGVGLDVVGGDDKDAFFVFEGLGQVGDARLFARVQAVPAVGLEAVAVQFLEAG